VRKKEFLKRKSKMVPIAKQTAPKKYNYYADNFEENKVSARPASSVGATGPSTQSRKEEKSVHSERPSRPTTSYAQPRRDSNA
jgi:hypothetical protein